MKFRFLSIKHVCILCLLFAFAFAITSQSSLTASAKKTYTVSTKTKPCDTTNHSKKYNKNTKHYWMLRSYLKKLEKQGGGTLILKKGTYTLSNALCVPSNTTIVLNDGVILKKTKKTGTKLMPAASSMFQFIGNSKLKKKGIIGEHNGEKNISIIGMGTATIDLCGLDMGKKPVVGIILGHASNITIRNIQFKNMRYGHFIEMDACTDVTVENCSFVGHKPSGLNNKEAINLDTPDPKTEGFSSKWSKMDSTPNENVLINACTFKNLETGVGTHQYSEGKFHANITIQNSLFDNTDNCIRVLNWENATITKNMISNCKGNSRYKYTMFMAGVKGITFSYNNFTNCGTPGGTRNDVQLLQFWCNAGYATAKKTYPATYSEITEEQADLFRTNNTSNCGVIRTYNCNYNIDFTNDNNIDNSNLE